MPISSPLFFYYYYFFIVDVVAAADPRGGKPGLQKPVVGQEAALQVQAVRQVSEHKEEQKKEKEKEKVEKNKKMKGDGCCAAMEKKEKYENINTVRAMHRKLDILRIAVTTHGTDSFFQSN